MSQQYNYKAPKDNKVLVGIIVVLVGVAFLMKALLPTILPRWLFSWQMVLIVVGLFIGARNQFRGWVCWVLIGVGLFNIINGNVVSLAFLRPVIFPAVIIFIGLSIIFRSRKAPIPPTPPSTPSPYQPPVDPLIKPDPASLIQSPLVDNPGISNNFHEGKQDNFHEATSATGHSDEDYVILSTYLGGNNRVVTSKRFQGAKLTCIMGGLEIDLHNADFQGTVVVDVFCAFGGLEIKVPSNWYVRNEVTPIIGGMEDNRRNFITHSQDKVLIIRGNVLFGGIELKS